MHLYKRATIIGFVLALLLAGFRPRLLEAMAYCGEASGCNSPGSLCIYNPPHNEPPCKKCTGTGSPVFVKTGNYLFSTVDLQLPPNGLPLQDIRTYDSTRRIDGLSGIGWASIASAHLTYGQYLYAAPSTYQRNVNVITTEGEYFEYTENVDGSYTPPIGRHDLLVKNGGNWDLTFEHSGITYHYSSTGAIQSATDEFGNAQNWTYDENGGLQQITDSRSGRYLSFYYGGDGRISTVQDSSGRHVDYLYDSGGKLTTFTDAAGRATTYSYVTGRVVPLLSQIKDKWNRIVTSVTYEYTDKIKSYTENGETYTYTYNYQGHPLKTSKVDSSNHTSVFDFDDTGQITQRKSALSHVANTTYDSAGNIQSVTDAEDIVTSYTYNTTGTIATVTRNAGGSPTVRYDYSYDTALPQYDPRLPEKVTAIIPMNPTTSAADLNWQGWKYDYYQQNDPAPGALYHVKRVESDGTTLDTLATYTYNSYGQVLTVTDATGGVTSYGYDATTGDLISVTYPKNSTSGSDPVYQYARDSAGRVTSVTDPLGNTTSYTYDNLDRILTVTLPKPTGSSTLNFTTTYSYDDDTDVGTSGLIYTNQTDPNGKVTKQGYDQYGQLGKSIDAFGNATNFTYVKGLLTSITDTNNNVTGYAYDSDKRLITTTFPNSSTETYTYFDNNILKTKKDRKNQTITYGYDGLWRLTAKTYPGGGNALTYAFTGQKLTSVVDSYINPSETYSFTYDSSYRTASSTQATRGTLTYTYDAADRVLSYAITGGPSATYVLYSDGSLKDVTSSLVSGQFHYDYTLNGQYGTITMPNGQHRDYTYDDQGRLTQIANIHPSAGNLATFNYGYDVDNYTSTNAMLGQRTSMSATVPALGLSSSVSNYYYDSGYQLTRTDYPNVTPFNAEIDSWTYDAIGNRLTNTVNSITQNYSYFKNGSNQLNGQRLQSDGIKTYAYDSNGNISGDGTYTNTWNYDNRISAISGGGLTASYTYDYLGRRSSKTVGGSTTTYIYDGQNLIAERGASVVSFR